MFVGVAARDEQTTNWVDWLGGLELGRWAGAMEASIGDGLWKEE